MAKNRPQFQRSRWEPQKWVIFQGSGKWPIFEGSSDFVGTVDDFLVILIKIEFFNFAQILTIFDSQKSSKWSILGEGLVEIVTATIERRWVWWPKMTILNTRFWRLSQRLWQVFWELFSQKWGFAIGGSHRGLRPRGFASYWGMFRIWVGVSSVFRVSPFAKNLKFLKQSHFLATFAKFVHFFRLPSLASLKLVTSRLKRRGAWLVGCSRKIYN